MNRERPAPELPTECAVCGKRLATAHKLDECNACLGRY